MMTADKCSRSKDSTILGVGTCALCMENLDPLAPRLHQRNEYGKCISRLLNYDSQSRVVNFFQTVEYCERCHVFLKDVYEMISNLDILQEELQKAREYFNEIIQANYKDLLTLEANPIDRRSRKLETKFVNSRNKNISRAIPSLIQITSTPKVRETVEVLLGSVGDGTGLSNKFQIEKEIDIKQEIDMNEAKVDIKEEEIEELVISSTLDELPPCLKVENSQTQDSDFHESDQFDSSNDFDGNTSKVVDGATRTTTRSRLRSKKLELVEELKLFHCMVPNCGRTYKEKGGRDRHFRRDHQEWGQAGDPRSFNCDECDTKKCTHPQHIANALECPYCKSLYSKTQRLILLDHIFRKHPEATKFHCNFCTKIHYFQEDCESHEVLHTEEAGFTCIMPPCSEQNVDLERLRNHVSIKHDGEKFLRYQCEACSQKLRNIHDYLVHIRIHTKERPFSCRIDGCDKKFFTSVLRRRHEKNLTSHIPRSPAQMKRLESRRKRTFKCTYCPVAYSTAEELDIHQLRRHEGVEKPFLCHFPGCKQSFKRRTGLKSHAQKLHVEINVAEDPRKFKYRCKFDGCRYTGSSEQGVEFHNRKIHQGQSKPFFCDICEKSYTGLLTLLNHRQIEHEGCDLLCNYCGDSYSKFQKYKLEFHIHFKHSDAEKFICSTCTKIFYLYENFELHQKLHKSFSTPFTCVMFNCKETFDRLEDLQSHVQEQHNKFQKYSEIDCHPVLCETCGKSCSSKRALSKHKRTVHVQSRRYKCRFCEKAYVSTDQRNHHEEAGHLSKDENTKKDYPCLDCGRIFHAKIYLYKHRSRRHRQHRATITSDTTMGNKSLIVNTRKSVNSTQMSQGSTLDHTKDRQETEFSNRQISSNLSLLANEGILDPLLGTSMSQHQHLDLFPYHSQRLEHAQHSFPEFLITQGIISGKVNALGNVFLNY